MLAIYLWAADELEPGWAYYVVYNSGEYARSKFAALGSQGYCCVRE